VLLNAALQQNKQALYHSGSNLATTTSSIHTRTTSCLRSPAYRTAPAWPPSNEQLYLPPHLQMVSSIYFTHRKSTRLMRSCMPHSTSTAPLQPYLPPTKACCCSQCLAPSRSVPTQETRRGRRSSCPCYNTRNPSCSSHSSSSSNLHSSSNSSSNIHSSGNSNSNIHSSSSSSSSSRWTMDRVC